MPLLSSFVSSLSLSHSLHFRFETRLDGHENCQDDALYYHCCVPHCNNNKRYNSGRDLSLIFNFPTKANAIFRMHNLVGVQSLCPSSLVSNPKWPLSGKGRTIRGHLVPLTQNTGMHLIASVPEQAKVTWKARFSLNDSSNGN